jgi:large subunit ribosomal protein L21
MYALIETGGKQYQVKAGDIIEVEKLEKNPDEKVTFDRVLLISEGEKLSVGQPYVKGATVSAKVVANGKDPKVVIFKYHNKTNYRRKTGHRQPFTRVQIEGIKE